MLAGMAGFRLKLTNSTIYLSKILPSILF